MQLRKLLEPQLRLQELILAMMTKMLYQKFSITEYFMNNQNQTIKELVAAEVW